MSGRLPKDRNNPFVDKYFQRANSFLFFLSFLLINMHISFDFRAYFFIFDKFKTKHSNSIFYL